MTDEVPDSARVIGVPDHEDAASADVQSDRVLDALAVMRDRTVQSFEEQTQSGGAVLSFDDPGFLTAHDRSLIAEACAKAGIAPAESPRGMIELANGLLAAEERRQLLEPKVRVEVERFRNELALLEARAPSDTALIKLEGAQAIVLQELGGATAKIAGEMDLANKTFDQEQQVFEAQAARVLKESERQRALLLNDVESKKAVVDHDLNMGRVDMVAERERHGDYVSGRRFANKQRRDETDLRHEDHRTTIYDKRYLIYSCIAAVILVIIIVVVLTLALSG